MVVLLSVLHNYTVLSIKIVDRCGPSDKVHQEFLIKKAKVGCISLFSNKSIGYYK